FALVSINVEDYLERGFDHLSVSFGCTGGQHRSVYAAEQLARYLAGKYELGKIKLQHLNEQNWVR
ncbi:RapZ C-terminal domain-containing protein, partial [Mycobacterium tuberculosis]